MVGFSLNCPNCGAAIKVVSKASVFVVCNYCKGTLLRKDEQLSHIGSVGEFNDGLTPLQIGTQGIYNHDPFTIVGRIVHGYKRGSWDEWYIACSPEKEQWLAHAQGFYMVSTLVSSAKIALPAKDGIATGLVLNIDDISFTIDDIREVDCIHADGELPFAPPLGRAALSVDCVSADGRFACIDYSDEGVSLYVGEYLTFDQLHFSRLRELDGWK